MDVEWLIKELKKRLPDVVVKVDEPELASGNYWLDIKRSDKEIVVEWRQKEGFGFFAEDASFGEGPNEIIADKEAALEKILSAFKT